MPSPLVPTPNKAIKLLPGTRISAVLVTGNVVEAEIEAVALDGTLIVHRIVDGAILSAPAIIPWHAIVMMEAFNNDRAR